MIPFYACAVNLGFYYNEKTGEPEIHPDKLKYLIESAEIPVQ